MLNLLFDANWQHSSPDKMKKILSSNSMWENIFDVDKDWMFVWLCLVLKLRVIQNKNFGLKEKIISQ